MRIFEVTEPKQRVPTLYLDMDGVQADFFTQWANWWGRKTGNPDVKWYKDIGDKAQREISIETMQKEGPEFVYEFFATLPVLSGADELLSYIRENNLPCTILSAPLRSPKEDRTKAITQASIEGKKAWLAQHGVDFPAIFDGQKDRYAKKGGGPNVLVDDHKKYISAWDAAGGIGILHRWNNVASTIDALNQIYSPFLAK